MGTVSKEVDAWLGEVTALLKERKVDVVPQTHLKNLVEQVLDKIGAEKLQTLDATDVLVKVRDEVPKIPGNMLNPEFITKNSDMVAKIVEGYYTAKKIRSGGLKTLGDGVVNELEARVAQYIAQLPKDVTIQREGLTLVLSKKGATAKVTTKIADISADVQGTKNKLQIDTADLKLKLESEGTSLRLDGKYEYVKGDLDLLVELHARRGKFKDDKSGEAAALDAKIEATYKDVKAKLDASLKQLSAKVEYLKKKPGLKELSAKLETDYKTLQGEFKLFYEKKDTTILAKALVTADKLEVEVNAKTITASGFNVQGQVKATLDKLDAKIEIFRKRKDADLKFVASLETDYKDLKAKAELIYKSTGKVQVELLAKFEATLDRVKASIEASVKADSWQVTAGASIDTQGASSGKAALLVKLPDGLQIKGENSYLKVEGSINDKEWNVFVGISLSSPPKPADVKKLMKKAEQNLNGAVGVLNDPAFDTADPAAVMSAMNKQLQAPPPPITLEAGFFLTDDIPKAGMPNLPMVGGVGLKVTWF